MENQDPTNKSTTTPQGGNQQGTSSVEQPQREETNKNKEANPSEKNITAEDDTDTSEETSEVSTENKKPKMSADVKDGNNEKSGTDKSAGNSTL